MKLVADRTGYPIEIVIDARVESWQTGTGAADSSADDTYDLMTSVFLYH